MTNWNWKGVRNILVVRADNMGDLIMSSPAIRALKKTFEAKITLLTSSMGRLITDYIPELDEVIVYDIPWVKSDKTADPGAFFDITEKLRQYQFDAAVIFTVCSQNPLPAAMLTYLAGIPKVLAYCRENPYHLVSHWVPDREPYDLIQHQVKRDLMLVEKVGADVSDDTLSLKPNCDYWTTAQEKLRNKGADITKPFIVFHPGVSEEKRQYPLQDWISIAKAVTDELHLPVVLTGAPSETALAESIRSGAGNEIYSLAGDLSVGEFISLIENAHLVVSVNTGTIHIAAALKTPVIVLYALTNPQHLPWKCTGKAFYFDVPAESRSRNEVISYLHNHLMKEAERFTPEDVKAAIIQFPERSFDPFPDLIPLR